MFQALFMDDLKLLQGAIASALGLQEDPLVAYLAQKKNIKGKIVSIGAILFGARIFCSFG